MTTNDLLGIIEFLRQAEQLKTVVRTSWTSGGQPESVASHTWRLCLMALVLGPSFPEVDLGRLLQICIVHDLGEAIGGDIPAIRQDMNAPKAGQERNDLLMLVESLPAPLQQTILALWDEYEAAASLEAKVAKALDKLETILQHNQGANPPDFDYAFNLDYGKKFTNAVPLAALIRTILDEETAQKAMAAKG